MESLFELRYSEDRQTLKRVYRRALRVRTIGTVVIILIAALVILLAWKNQSQTLQLVAVIVYLLAIGWELTLPWRLIGKRLRLRRSCNRGEPLEIRMCFAESLTLTEGANTLVIPYREIPKVTFAKESILLWTRNSGVLAVEATHFTKGDFSEFEKFIRKECLEPKIAGWS